MIIHRKTIFASTAVIFLIVLVSPWFCFVTHAQTETAYTPTDAFAIPAYNSTISFATGGTYEQASLENNMWKFVNLRWNNTGLPENLTVSAQNSNVKITTYQRFNASTTAARLRYTVLGHGTQTFNFGLTLKDGSWTVSLNGVIMGENGGYSVSPDQTITVTGATANASISYFNLNAFGGTTEDPNLPFYLKHRVAIATGIVVAVAVVLTAVIRIRKPEGK